MQNKLQSLSRAKRGQRMRDLPLNLRPRERLVSYGPQNLSDAELIAILLGTGIRGSDALAVGEALLRKYPLKELAQTPVKQLQTFKGVGLSKAARLVAGLELGERLFAPVLLNKVRITSTSDTVDQLKDIANKKQEHLVVFYLNARQELLQKEIVGIGTLNAMRITPKEIFTPALQTPCASLIVAHNHPSNDPTPSDDDIHFTKVLQEAGEIMGIPLFDHVIISPSGYFSFRDGEQS
jgi:DNA repair protein RadC